MQEEIGRRRLGVSAAMLKWVALLTMLIDHIGYTIMPVLWTRAYRGFFPWSAPELIQFYYTLRSIGRLAFPLYLFLLDEGFLHSRDRKKYLLRLGAFALLSEIPFDLAFNNTMLEFGSQNVFFTLFFGFAALLCFDFIRKSKLHPALQWLGILAVALAAPQAASLLKTDYGALGVVAVELEFAVAFLCRRLPERWRPLGNGLRWCVMLPPLLLSSRREIWMMAVLPLVMLYDGRRGRQPSRWFFYGFYPGHLLLLAWLSRLLADIL